jgi:hypothetical protein
MLELALDRFAPGDATFVYLSDVDLQCHMLWRHADPKYPGQDHPARDAEVARAHAHDIERFYQDVDAALGRVRERLPDGTLLIVMSDHGFQPYLRKFHLNAWLRDRGYLVMKGEKRTGRVGLDDVDWRARAYGIGFNGLYLNLADAGAGACALMSRALAEEIGARSRPSAIANGKPSSPRTRGPRCSTASARPRDRTSWSVQQGYAGSDPPRSARSRSRAGGQHPRWSGNHLIDPRLVPGVLLVNARAHGDTT